eukprot:CAMPEP_0118975316 /NCGR_PEP_ID=MMETSP1173-20130426/15410_1 /TAXON_ID=1034831 /ORGANISM="Rhizochromulina marina cf, Strain CCMP1243" /LENGTH=182 /DNA_ID=CAMNT_0006925187 /DNA_START=42 /DNA_END=593 /DNA_ORIENTATION=+
MRRNQSSDTFKSVRCSSKGGGALRLTVSATHLVGAPGPATAPSPQQEKITRTFHPVADMQQGGGGDGRAVLGACGTSSNGSKTKIRAHEVARLLARDVVAYEGYGAVLCGHAAWRCAAVCILLIDWSADHRSRFWTCVLAAPFAFALRQAGSVSAALRIGLGAVLLLRNKPATGDGVWEMGE